MIIKKTSIYIVLLAAVNILLFLNTIFVLNLSPSLPLGLYRRVQEASPYVIAEVPGHGKILKSWALPGTVRVEGHELYIGGEHISTHAQDWGRRAYEASPDMLFLYSAHPRSLDSRHFGLVSKEKIAYALPFIAPPYRAE